MSIISNVWIYTAISVLLFVLYFSSKLFRQRAGLQRSILNAVIVPNLKLPLFIVFITLLVYYGVYITVLSMDGAAVQIMRKVLPTLIEVKNLSIIVAVSWYLLRTLVGIREYFQEQTQPININVLSKILQVVIISSATLLMIDAVGLNISGIVTFGGIGGVAAGFAAKDLLSNFFGSFVIMLDKPFGIGDMISSPDKKISGVVLAIGWRVTKLLTYEKRQIYVPNSMFASVIIQNDSRMTHRRIDDMLRVKFVDIEVVSLIIQKVKVIIHENPGIDNTQLLSVSVDSIGNKIFTMHIYAFTKTTAFVQYKIVKQNVLIKIAQLVYSMGAQLVFPDATIEVHENTMCETVSQSTQMT